jgi:hypothetical protein
MAPSLVLFGIQVLFVPVGFGHQQAFEHLG